MPPAIVKGFAADTNFKGPRPIEGLGSDIGPLKHDDGMVIDGGRALMKYEWNTELYDSLPAASAFNDMWVPKNRLSGFCGGTGIEHALTCRGIRMLLFAGANTEQCVRGSLQDALTKGWDCLMLSDGCGTTSPEFAKRCIEFNCEEGWGFVLTCK